MRIQPPIDQEKFYGKKATQKRTLSFIGSHRLISNNEKEILLKKYIVSDEGLDDFEYRENFLTMFPYEIQPLARWAIIKMRKDMMSDNHHLLDLIE